MAYRWRIRHKLMLGMGLVVGIIALLLAGTVYGLASYRATMKSIDSKVAEMRAADAFRHAIQDLCALEVPAFANEKVLVAQNNLKTYHDQLTDTLNRGRDPENGEVEKGFVENLDKNLTELSKLAQEARSPRVESGGDGKRWCEDESVKPVLDSLRRDSGDLSDRINKELWTLSRDGTDTFKTSLWIVGAVSVVGVVLLWRLLSVFYRWMFYPIRDLEQGAGRVAQGDFEHRIDVHSGDELEDLAEAFNNMTGRLCEVYRDLARQVNERSRQLIRSERLASVGFLAAGVAHEINNPLASIAFCSEALDQRLAEVLTRVPEDSEIVTKYLKMIQQEAFRCKVITQRLLEFSRGGERRREQTDLVEIIKAELEMVENLPNAKGKQIIFEPPARVDAWANGLEIKQVILNLVVNALDSMDDTGTLTITLQQRDRAAEICFADSGCGMSAEVLENIFEPFFTRSRTGKGTGLGLSISHRIINEHGGEIEAASPGPNLGSTFTVRLPLDPVEPVSSPSKEETLGHAAA